MSAMRPAAGDLSEEDLSRAYALGRSCGDKDGIFYFRKKEQVEGRALFSAPLFTSSAGRPPAPDSPARRRPCPHRHGEAVPQASLHIAAQGLDGVPARRMAGACPATLRPGTVAGTGQQHQHPRRCLLPLPQLLLHSRFSQQRSPWRRPCGCPAPSAS